MKNINAKNRNRIAREPIDPFELLSVIASHIGIVIVAVIVCVVIASAHLSTIDPTYKSTALLRIKPNRSFGASMLDAKSFGSDGGIDQHLIATYRMILQSRSVIEPIMSKITEPDEHGVHPAYSEAFAAERIEIEQLADTEMVRVSFRGNTPETAQRGNELLLESFMKRLAELDSQQAHETSQFIEQRVINAKIELERTEDALGRFQKAKKLLAPNDQAAATTGNLTAIDKMKSDNQMALALAKTKREYAIQQLKSNAYSAADNEIISGCRQKLTELELERIGYMEKYTSKHPKVIAVNQAIAVFKKRMAEEIDKVAESGASTSELSQKLISDKLQAEAEIEIANSNLAAIKSIEEKYKNDVNSVADTQREYLRHMRDVTIAEEIYLMLAKRLEESKVAEASVTRNVYIIDKPALDPTPLGPDKTKRVRTAVAVGIILSCAFIIIRHLMNSTIRTPDDIHKHLELSILGQIPSYNAMEKVKDQRQSDKTMWQAIKERFGKHKRYYKQEHDDSIRLISLTDSNSPVAEAYRTIRTNIQFANISGGNGNALKTIIITSSVRNAGKSTSIANLALVMAQAGSKVLLVDCDLRNPTLHKLFKLPKVGLTNIVATGADPADCIRQCEHQENLYLLPAGPVPPNPSELLCSHRVEELIGFARDYYDYVLLDMPPILPVTDAAVMSSKVDGVIMCVACNSTHPSMERQAEDLLQQAGAKIIGVIMNKVDVASSTYYGKYYGHYNYGYYYYYYGEENGERKKHHQNHKDRRFAWIKKFLRSLTRWSDS